MKSLLRLLAPLSLLCATPALAGFHVEGARILQSDGTEFVMRGVNDTQAWTPTRTHQALIDIAATGANTVRIPLGLGAIFPKTSPDTVAAIIAQAKSLGLIAILEVHDTTGYPQNEEAIHLGAAIGYWASIVDVLRGQEDYVMINIGNEPNGSADGALWAESHRAAITALRQLGMHHTIIIDGPGWGQDSNLDSANYAQGLFDIDPDKNLIFSIHMYQVYGTPERVQATFDAYQRLGLPLIIGEFGNDHQGEPVDEATIFRLAQERNIGWLAWSWGGNGAMAANLNMTNDFNAQSLSPWGQLVVHGPMGLSTARRAHIFNRP